MKRFMLFAALATFACACHAGTDMSGLRIYHIKCLRSGANPKAIWYHYGYVAPGKSYIFTGPKGVTIDSAKDNLKLLRVIVDVAHNKPIMTSSDLAANANVQSSGSHTLINLTLNEPAARRFAEFTKKNAGAVTGFFLNGKLIGLPRIVEPVLDGHIQMSGYGDEKRAKQIVDAVNRSGPCPKCRIENASGALTSTCGCGCPQTSTCTCGSPRSTALASSGIVVPKGKKLHNEYDEFPYTEKKKPGFTQAYGTMHSKVRWTKAKSPYLVTENVFVADDASLTVDPGVMVRFLPPPNRTSWPQGIGLDVRGCFSAEGTPTAKIVFTSAANNPRWCDWDGIHTDWKSVMTMTWCVVKYSGTIFTHGIVLVEHCVFDHCHSGAWLNTNSIADVRNNVFAYNMYSGIRVQQTPPNCVVLDNIVYRCGDGIDLWGDAASYLDHNLLFGNRPQYYQSAVPSPHDVQLDPKFVDPEKSDYRLAADSPARRAGSGGSDIGLCQETWSPQLAKREKSRFFGNGALEQWAQSRNSSGRESDPTAMCRLALEKATDPWLRDRIACDLAGRYIDCSQYDDAEKVVNDVLSKSELAPIRDWGRRLLARIHAKRDDYGQALQVLEETEWPQSITWKDRDIPTYLALAGRADEALAAMKHTANSAAWEYLQTLRDLVDKAVSKNLLDVAKSMLAGFSDYPFRSDAMRSRLRVAYALRDAGRCQEALELLKENDADPMSETSTETLYAMATILKDSLGKPDEADKVLTRLATNYIPEDKFVAQARDKLGAKPAVIAKDKLILMDTSLGTGRTLVGRHDSVGQWHVMSALIEAGFTVHTNELLPKDCLPPEMIDRYGLVVMNDRYCNNYDNPPMSQALIDSLVAYVKDGGSLIVVSEDQRPGENCSPEFYAPLLKRFGLGFSKGPAVPYDQGRARTVPDPRLGEPFEFEVCRGVEVESNGGKILANCGSTPVAVAKDYGKGRALALGAGYAFIDFMVVQNRLSHKDAFVRFVKFALAPR